MFKINLKYIKNLKIKKKIKSFILKKKKKRHRHPIDHKCIQVKKEKNEAELKKQEIKNLISNVKNSAPAKATVPAIKKKGKKLNPKIELIKMKAKAKVR